MRTQVDVMRAVMAALEQQLELVEGELRRFARTDRRCQALETIFGVGPILACQLLAEIGDVRRFRRARQLVRASGLDPVVLESAESKPAAGLPSRDHHTCAGRSWKQHNTRIDRTVPTKRSTPAPSSAAAAAGARLTVARKIGRRAYHVLAAEAA